MERTSKGRPRATADLPELRSAVQQNGSGNKPNRQQVQLLGQLGHRDPDPETGPTVPRHPTVNGRAPEAIEKALRLLNDGKSVREVAAVTGLSKSKVGRLRSKYSVGRGTPLGQSDPIDPANRVSQTPSTSPVARTRGFDGVPEINSLWFSNLTDAERTRFVDGVGLWHLLLAAPQDHREAFLDRLRTWTTAQARKAVVAASAPAPTSTDFPDLPDFLDRRRELRSHTTIKISTSRREST